MTNTLAYNGMELVMPLKCFIVQAPGVNVTKYFVLSSWTLGQNKLERFYRQV